MFILILGGLFALLTFLDQGREYEAEKALWKINFDFESLKKDPKATPEISYNVIAKRYKEFTEKYSNSNLNPAAYLFMGRVYMYKKEYQKARDIFEDLIVKYKDKEALVMEAVAEIGRCYALEEDWDNVLNTYQRIIKEYPLTELGIRTPIYIAKFYLDNEKEQEAQKAFNDAVSYYKKMVQDYPDSPIEFASLRLMATSYIALKQWNDAVDTFGFLLLKYAGPPFMSFENADKIIKSINTISVAQIQNYDQPIRIYSEFIQKYPKHPFSESLAGMIKSFEELQQKNVSHVTQQRIQENELIQVNE